jgi:hypothetical protein
MAKSKINSRLVISFIGNTDLRYIDPVNGEMSPILRLLSLLPSLEPHVPAEQTRMILFDDRPGNGERESFCKTLVAYLPEIGLTGLDIRRHPIHLPKGPTDLNALYETVWVAISPSERRRADEVIFHLSSGTPAMKLTLLLAANCLRLDKVRLFETSREQTVNEVRLPYVLASREVRERGRALGRLQLTKSARRQLLPDTVFDDPLVEAAYSALHKAATNRKVPQRLLVKGPVGSGKWRACEQFTRWRGQDTAQWLEPGDPPEPPRDATLLIRHLDTWPQQALQRLALLSAERPDLAIAATFRSDLPPLAPLATLACDGLRGATHIELPALGARSDVVALGEALARQLGVPDGKLKERLQFDWLTDLYPRNLHDLKQLLATAAAHSQGAHPERGPYLQARQIRDAHTLFGEAWRILAGMDFGPGRYRLDNVLDVIRSAIVRRALADGRSQDEAGRLLGISQQTISTIIRQEAQLAEPNRERG